MKIRMMESKDVGQIMEMAEKIVSKRPQEYIDWFRRDLLERIEYYLKNGSESGCLVAVENGEVVAYAIAGVVRKEEKAKFYFLNYLDAEEPMRWLMLDYIAVAPEGREKGVGSALLKRLSEISAEKGLKGVYTGTRGRAKEFYLKNGFQEDKIFLKKVVAATDSSPG